MILALVASLQLAAGGASVPAGPASAPADSIPVVTLPEALRRATNLDPDYVAALRDVGDAAWVRRSAFSAFVLPSVEFQTTATRFSTEIFNPGTNALTTRLVQSNLNASYDLFRGGARFFDLGRAKALQDRAREGERESLFESALRTESDYYDVLAQKELRGVAAERVRRAEEQLTVARARVLSGAAVQTDSLQLLLEATRARVALLRQESALTVARLQLGRRIGEPGPVDAAALDTTPAAELPLTQEEAVHEAITASPRALVARADERAAEAGLKSARGGYLPQVSLFGQWTGFDESFFPTATTRTLYGLSVSVPIWNGAQRELAVYRAGTDREVSRARRRDEELAVARDMVEAYQAYTTARASAGLARRSVLVARENLRVQEERYRSGATTIIDLITAQVSLAEAEADLVQARFATRLAFAGVEALLGRRLPLPRGGTG
ncbi:MAG: TolC family protein [Gemmatimonadota bacterium]